MCCRIFRSCVINLANGGFDMSIKLSGEGAILLSAAAYALSSGMIKKYSKDENPVVLSGYQFFLGGIILVVVGIATGGKISGFTLASIALLIYMAMISAVAYTLWGILLKYNPVGKVAVFGFTNPIFGVILSADDKNNLYLKSETAKVSKRSARLMRNTKTVPVPMKRLKR